MKKLAAQRKALSGALLDPQKRMVVNHNLFHIHKIATPYAFAVDEALEAREFLPSGRKDFPSPGDYGDSPSNELGRRRLKEVERNFHSGLKLFYRYRDRELARLELHAPEEERILLKPHGCVAHNAIPCCTP
jgi:hypothetical protein